MKTVIIVQARMGSTRLPGKVLKKVLWKPLLGYLLERLLLVESADEIVVATTDTKIDDAIVKVCKYFPVFIFRGDEENVLSRYYFAAKERSADIIVRITADCPLIDYKIVDLLIQKFKQKFNQCDYLSNTLVRTFPRGMDTEIFSFDVLEKAFNNAKSKSELEHVTHYMRNNNSLKLINFSNESDQSRYRLTVDTIEDFELIKKIISNLHVKNRFFEFKDIIFLLENNPKWFYINSNIKQKYE